MLANLGIPMVMVEFWLMLVVGLPVVWLEARWYEGSLNLPARLALKGSLWANAITLAVGIPVSWMLSLAYQTGASDVLRARILASGGESRHLLRVLAGPALVDPERAWVIPVALALLLGPSLLLSVWLELKVCRRLWRLAELAAVRRAVWQANLLSYAGLLAGCCLKAAYSFLPR